MKAIVTVPCRAKQVQKELNTRKLCTVTAVAAVMACGGRQYDEVARAPSIDVAAVARIEDSLRRLVDQGQIPGAALFVRHAGHDVRPIMVGYADIESRTPVTAASIFRLASATKIWTAVLALNLVDDGKILLDVPVSTYLPEWTGQRVLLADGSTRTASKPLTIRDLLRHTAGMGYGSGEPYKTRLARDGFLTVGGRFARDWTHPWTLDEWSRRLAALPLEDEPGTRFSYGLGQDLLGRVIERASGKSLPLLMKERVLDPLGLRDTGFALEAGQLARLTSFYRFEGSRLVRLERGSESPFRTAPNAASGGGGWDPIGNGGMVSSPTDFLRLLQMVLNRGELDGVRIIKAETAQLLFTNQLADIGSGDSFWPGAGFSFGAAVLYDTARYSGPGLPGKIWWAGSTNVHFWVDPDHQLIGVFMTHMLPFGHGDVMDVAQRLTYEAAKAPSAR